jgi:hypothetical protein
MSVTANTLQFPVRNFNDPLADLVEEFVELHNRLSPEMDRYEVLKKELGKIANLDTSDGPMILAGYEHLIDYSAPTESLICAVSAREVVELSGKWQALTVSITEAKNCLTPLELGAMFTMKRGSRRFKRIR